MAEYYYSDGNNKYGPYSVEEMRSKKLDADTLVWHERLPDWMRAGDLPELLLAKQEIKAPPPLPPGGIPKRGNAPRAVREKDSFSSIATRYKWVWIWCAFHILAYVLARNEVKYFNTTGIPRTEKFWPFVKFTDAYFTKVQSEPQEVWKTQVVFNGFFTNYDWSELSFYVGSAVFLVILLQVYRRTK